MKSRVLFALALVTSVFIFCISVPTLVSAQSGKAIGFHNNHAEVYITFQQPLKAKERGKIKRVGGIRFYAAVSETTYLARIREPALAKLRNHPLFTDIRPVELTDKLSTNLNTGSVGPNVVNPDGTLAVYVRFYDDVKLPHALKSLRKTGIDFEKPKRFLLNNRILVNATNEQILLLAQKINVRHIDEIPPPPRDDNVNAAIFSNIDLIQAAPFDLDGDGVRFGQWELGHAQTGHPDLSPRIHVVEAGDGISDHATHVAGTMLGSGAGDANALGMAPGAWGIFAYSSAGNPPLEQVAAVADDGIVIANHSWGRTTGWDDDGNDLGEGGFGIYDSDVALYDEVVSLTGLIIVKSAGNDSNDCNPDDSNDCDGFPGGDGNRYDTIGYVGNAKNIITVGAVGNTVADPLITGFSSNGPSDDGRIKPDLVAKGDLLWSTCPTSTYCDKGGTSMSAPTTSGATALLIQTYRLNFDGLTPSPDIVKALLVNTARDLGRPGPDYVYGHGLLDALPAAQTIDIGEVKIVTEAVGQSETDEYLLSVPAGLTELRVTLNWIDIAGSLQPGIRDNVNNLDVLVEAPDGSLRYPFIGPGMGNVTGLATATGPNSIDTVESIVIDTPDQGIWIVRVGGAAVPLGPQNYALVANGFDGTGNIVRTSSFILPDQPDIRVSEALAFDELCEGDKQDLLVSIFNIGGADLLVHEISTAGSSAFSVLPDPSQPFIVQPGAHIEVTIRFEPDGIWGLYNGTLHIVSNDPDEGELAFEMTGELGRSIISTVIADTGNYGDVCSDDFSDLGLTIANGGGCPLVVDNISSNSGEFFVPQVLDYPLDIGAADSMEVPIRFEPFGSCDDTTPREGVIIIQSNDPVLLTPVGVSGFMPCPNLVIDPDAMTGLFAFPATVVDPEGTLGCYSEQSVTIRNTGRCPLNITSVNATGNDFTAIAPAILPIELPPGEETLLVDIMFTPQSGGDPLSPDEVTGTLTIISDDPDASGLADLCGEGVAQSGVRILVTDVTSGLPLTVAEADEIKLRSKGIKTPGPINLRFTDQPITSSTVCGNSVQWHVNLETLPATHTTGTNPTSSYTASAKEDNMANEESFSLAQCEFREFQLQLRDTSGDGGICPLGQKGDVCTTDAECCSNKCRGPDGNKTCK